MAKQMTLAQFEELDGALASVGYAERADAGDAAGARTLIQAQNRLYDAVIDFVGYDVASAMTEAELRGWAATRVVTFLCTA